MTAEIKQNESWKERFIEQKDQLSKMSQTIEDLQTRLQISLQSHSELEKKHQEEIDQLNSQRISETIYMKTNFSKKENQLNETISNLKEKNKSLKTEIVNSTQKFNELQKKIDIEKPSPNEQSFTPFTIQIPTTESEIKWKNRYKNEKEKKKKIKNLQLQQEKIIDEKQHQIETLEKKIEEKQNIIYSMQQQQQQQTETSIMIQSLQQKLDDLQSQNSFSSQEAQNRIIQQSNNNMEHELASFFNEQNEIHNKKINSLSLKLSKAIQIINDLKEKNEILKDKMKQFSSIQDDLNNALFENKEKDRIIRKFGKKIQSLQSKNKALKKIVNEFKHNQNLSQQQSEMMSSSSTEIGSQNSSQIFDKLYSIFDSHKNEINSMIQSNSHKEEIPTNLLLPELVSQLSGSELKIERIIEWYNNKINTLKIDSKHLRIMKNVISSCFTDVQFNMDNNKVFCEQVRNEINSLKDRLRELTLKQQQLQLSTIYTNNIGNA